VAKSIIDGVRGEHDEYVFFYRGRPIEAIHNTGWQEARKRAGLPHVRVHDLKHTFGRRLRAAGVSFDGRQDLLRAPLRPHYYALLGRGVGEPDRSSELGVRGGCPQNAHTRHLEKTSARRGRGKRLIGC
jgi:hypothetical protein